MYVFSVTGREPNNDVSMNMQVHMYFLFASQNKTFMPSTQYIYTHGRAILNQMFILVYIRGLQLMYYVQLYTEGMGMGMKPR